MEQIGSAKVRLDRSAPAASPYARVASVDILRGIAIVMVVAGHANRGAMEEHVGSTAVAKWLDWFFYALHMPVFFYLAGFFAANSLRKVSINQYIFSRGRAILLPYVIWSVIAVIVSVVMARLTPINHPLSTQDLLEIGWRPINILWFLYAILIFQVVASLFRDRPETLLVISLAATCGLWLYGIANGQEIVPRVLNQAPFFFAGSVVAKRYGRPLWTPPELGMYILAGSLIFLMAMMWAMSYGITAPVQFVTLPISAAGVVTLMLISGQIGKHLDAPCTILAMLGRASMAIYLMHVYTLALVPRLLLHMHADDALARILLGTLFGVAGPLSAFLVMERLDVAKYLGLR